MDELEIKKCELRRMRPVFLHAIVFPFIAALSILIFKIFQNYDPNVEAVVENDTIINNTTLNATTAIDIAVGPSWFHFLQLHEEIHLSVAMLLLLFIIEFLAVLFTFWSVSFRTYTSSSKAKIDNATHVFIVPSNVHSKKEIIPLHVTHNAHGTDKKEYFFLFRKAKYIYEEDKKHFVTVNYPIDHSLAYYQQSKGLETEKCVEFAAATYGYNELKIPVPSFYELLSIQAVQPFFVFQVFCVLLWSLDDYVFYSLLTLGLLVVLECTVVSQRRRNLRQLVAMTPKPFHVLVYRTKKWIDLLSTELLPGDICLIESSEEHALPCDMLLLSGSCVVNEAMLTGESTPTVKESIQDLEDTATLDVKNVHKRNVLFGGTYLLHHQGTNKGKDHHVDIDILENGNKSLVYILRNGFGTNQGKLMRTILFGAKEVNANSLDSLIFILFLLIFAVAASAYVWIQGTAEGKRDKWKLLLECTLIITSVIPPDLPMQLSLAVNNSLISLMQLAIFCTEPFRIPFAGKITICCFDKTGTLTDDDLELEGIGDCQQTISPMNSSSIISEALASCHSLTPVKRFNSTQIIGDPTEKKVLEGSGWFLEDGITSVSPDKKMASQVLKRFHFSSSLKRMSVVANVMANNKVHSKAFIKGAPEIIQEMFVGLDQEAYKKAYISFARQGFRVLAFGYKDFRNKFTPNAATKMTRAEIEKGLTFLGFILLKCPIKPETTKAIKQLRKSSHQVVMITGDNALTACHVAKQVQMIHEKNPLFTLTECEKSWKWVDNYNSDVSFDLSATNLPKKRTLCVTGKGFDQLLKNNLLDTFIGSIKVYARTNPEQKEKIIAVFRDRGHSTLMCGDGTNDVGALKKSHVGIALVKGKYGKTFFSLKKKIAKGESVRSMGNNDYSSRQRLQQQINDSTPPVVELGDASFASPFTSKIPSIMAVVNVIRQGRCTLVTTLQMYKILAVNCLIGAYCLSVLYLDDVKFSDYQYTLQGVLIAASLFFISRSEPAETLSKERPISNICNLYLFSTVMLQFFVHIASLTYILQLVEPFIDRTVEVDRDADFKDTILNSAVFVVSLFTQNLNILVNYQGKPFMGGLWDNKKLLFLCLLTNGCLLLTLVDFGGTLKLDMAEQMGMIDLPNELGQGMVIALGIDAFSSFFVDRLMFYLFGHVPHKPI